MSAWWFFRAPHVASVVATVVALLSLYAINDTLWPLLAVPVMFALDAWSPHVPRNRWAFWTYYPGHLAALVVVLA